jgi:hypothetical protein
MREGEAGVMGDIQVTLLLIVHRYFFYLNASQNATVLKSIDEVSETT